ncbi:MAG: gliding motility-associated C-terminal domain-containing protein [Bacteroidales bacterium]|nr:gliding motility-associated C-terminal domain-containing protein [Bacteroidales bacterium]
MNRLKVIIIVFFTCVISQAMVSQTDIPDPPVFTSASIIPESDPTTVELRWSPSDSIDVEGYIVYQVIGGITETIDTVFGRLTTSFEYTMPNLIVKPEKFRLAAFDALDFKSSITDPHTTMFLNLEFDKCNTEVKLDWTAYEGWSNGINSFKVYRRAEGGPYSVIQSLSADKLAFTDDDVSDNQTYYYYVEAISNSGLRATSNSVELTTNSYIAPEYMHAQYASVDGENIVVSFIVDNSAEVLEYRVQRSASSDGTFTTIKSYPNSGQNEVMHVDYDVNVNEYRYYYRLTAVNPCGVEMAYSNIASNIILNVLTDDNLSHDIFWTGYYAWSNGVSNYKVFRYFDGNRSEIGVNTPGDLDYTYNIDWYVNYCHDRKIHMTNEFCYYVEAYESESPEFASSQGVSRSNIDCVYHDPVVWIPNAFNATSVEPENREFKPVLSFVESEPYEFIVYDRFGQEVFKTEETYEGWNGQINYSQLAPSQYYTYFVRYFNHQGKEYIKTGTFFLFID